MEIRVRETGQLLTMSEFKSLHNNTSFPPSISEELINDLGADVVFEGPQPVCQRYEVLVRDGATFISGKWYTKYVAIEMDEEAKTFKDKQQATAIREQRNKALQACDWTQLEDASVDKALWVVYRQHLRDIPAQIGFPWDVQWPIKP